MPTPESHLMRVSGQLRADLNALACDAETNDIHKQEKESDIFDLFISSGKGSVRVYFQPCLLETKFLYD